MILLWFDVMLILVVVGCGFKMSEILVKLCVLNGNIMGIVDKLSEEGIVVCVFLSGDRCVYLV